MPETKQSKGASDRRFRLLVCIDGSEESERALKYAVRVGSGTDADMTLLYVRPVDPGLGTGGLQISLARQNLLDWGIELPGMKALTKARDQLVDLGYMGADWEAEFRQTEVMGDPLGDQIIIYQDEKAGRKICLKLLVSPSVADGILDQCDIDTPDIVILSASEEPGIGLGHITPSVAETVAKEHTGTVLVARGLEQSHGHLVCVWDNEQSIQAARRDAEIAGRCACPVYLYAVAKDDSELEAAERAIANAEAAIEEAGIRISGKKIDTGDPVEKIIEEGKDYSVIVMSTKARTGLRRFFTQGTSFRVLQRAHNSVMIAR